jgi:hypothetical protein
MSAKKTKRPKLRLAPPLEVEQPAVPVPGGPAEDDRAWGLVFDAIEEALSLQLSSRGRASLVRCRGLIGALARRPRLQAATGGGA